MKKVRRAAVVVQDFEAAGSQRLAAAIAHELMANDVEVTLVATQAADGPLSREMGPRGVHCIGPDGPSRSRFGLRRTLRRLLRQERPDVVLVHGFMTLGRIKAAARSAGVRRLLVAEYGAPHRDSEGLAGLRLRRLARTVEAVAVGGEDLRRWLVDRARVAAKRVHVIPVGVDTMRFRPAGFRERDRAELGDAEGEYVLVGCIARLHSTDDHRRLIEAARCLRERGHQRFRLVLIGGRRQRPHIEDAIIEAGVGDHITLLGERSDVDKLMPQLDIFMLAPRKMDLPPALFEAMSCGVPCVVSDFGNVSEVVDEQIGRVAASDDGTGLAEALEALLNDPGERSACGRRARERVLERHEGSAMVAAYRQLLLGGGRQPSGGTHTGDNAATVAKD